MRNMMSIVFMLSLALSLQAGEQDVWKDGKPVAALVCPQQAGATASIVETTINGYLSDKYGLKLPLVKQIDHPGLYIVVGNKTNNPVLADLVKLGVDVPTSDLGEEGFRIATHDAGDRRFLIVTANTPAGLKYGCQELVFFHMPATTARVALDWPLEMKQKPQIAYRGSYILPCWAPRDSIDTWRKVLEFNSEITVNRNWFWLAGFPLIKEHGGKYAGADLAKVDHVVGLVNLCRANAMKFYLGGGWFTWHHRYHCGPTGDSIQRGVHPYSIPHFAQEYWYRERCWDVRATREQFISRLARRLFDADMPAEAIQYYMTLSDLCLPPAPQSMTNARAPKGATEEVLAPIGAFVKAHATHGTARNCDTLSRMREAIDGFRKTRATENKKK